MLLAALAAAVTDGELDADAAWTAIADWAAERGTPLYPAQEEAVLEALLGRHVVLSTPTGSGKSLVATVAHALVLARGGRSFYTAPIKALVSEKFFEAVAEFGAERVGMITGDTRINPDAPLICCTAEILANTALRHGPDAPVDQVIADEFHFYADPDRGWAWQVPLLELTRTRFVLLSATLGDTSAITADLGRRSGREVATVTGVERPVPLAFRYSIEPLHETVETLLSEGLGPLYLVHFAQAAAVASAQALSGARVADRAQRERIAEALQGVRLSRGFGTVLGRLLRAGVGVHHAGMLPRYRRLVESLAQRGLLRVVCGTDTLGVGINVPIRTVVLTALSKYDGRRMRRLSAREFHQIAGRAGRAGFDVEGDVVVLAPEHEIETAKALTRAGDDPKKRKKVVRRKAPEGFVGWDEAAMTRLIASEPEPLRSRMRITAAMLVQVIARGSRDGAGVFDDVRALVRDNHEPVERRRALALRALGIYRTLRTAGVVAQEGGGIGGAARIRLTVELQQDFALNQPLSPFALAVVELLDPAAPGYALDVVSVIESTLENPVPVLMAQRDRARGEAVQAMKAEGIEYEERMERLDDVTWPEPLGRLLAEAFETFAASQPWVRDQQVKPKAVVRELWEAGLSFADYVALYGIGRSEGTLLRYLSDAWRALRQTVPASAKTEELSAVIEWLGEVVRQVDSSLVDEWRSEAEGRPVPEGDAGPVLPPAPPSVVANRRAFTAMVRNALWRRVELAARQADAELEALDPTAGWPHALDRYYADHDRILIDADARSSARVAIDERPSDGDGGAAASAGGTAGAATEWRVRQTLSDPAGDHDWIVSARVDLVASAEAGEPVIAVESVARLD